VGIEPGTGQVHTEVLEGTVVGRVGCEKHFGFGLVGLAEEGVDEEVFNWYFCIRIEFGTNKALLEQSGSCFLFFFFVIFLIQSENQKMSLIIFLNI